jgi:hypothetical protein
MAGSSVVVLPITEEDQADLFRGDPVQIELGANSSYDLSTALSEVNLAEILGPARRNSDIFILDWEGARSPRGAVVNGHTISSTQHGIVYTEKDMIGTYERLVDQGGESGRQNVMLVYIDRPDKD